MRRWVRLVAVFGLLVGMLAVAVPVSAAGYFAVKAQVSYPAQYSDETIWVRLCHDRECSDPGVGVPVHTVWNYRTTTSYLDWQTGTDGRAAMIRNISDATCGYTVRVDIYVTENYQQIDSAYFTPCGDIDANARAILNYGSIAQATAAASPYNPPSPPVSQGPVSGSGGVCPSGYPVKANDNSGIYHVPGQQFYDATNARNCYATPAAAERDGYRASKV